MQLNSNLRLPFSAITSLASYFCAELIDILYAEIIKKTTTHVYAADLIAILREVIRKASEASRPYLPNVADMVLRAMGLSIDQPAEELIKAVSLLVKTLLIRYRCVAFDQETEFLGIGTAKGPIVVYALKQHQKLKVLEGQRTASTVLAFSRAGGKLGSYCERERTLRVWRISSGMLSFSGILNRSVVMNIDTYKKRTKLGQEDNKETRYPALKLTQEKNLVRLYLSPEEAYEYAF